MCKDVSGDQLMPVKGGVLCQRLLSLAHVVHAGVRGAGVWLDMLTVSFPAMDDHGLVFEWHSNLLIHECSFYDCGRVTVLSLSGACFPQ